MLCAIQDRGETEYRSQQDDNSGASTPGTASPVKTSAGQPAAHSSQSSLTSLDLALGGGVQCAVTAGEEQGGGALGKAALCRVILSDGATTVVQIRPQETVRQLANRLLDKRGLNYSAYEVYIADHSKV